MNTREAFEKGTERFNAQDVQGFAEVLADDVVFTAPTATSRRPGAPSPWTTFRCCGSAPAGALGDVRLAARVRLR
jgi:hypothetical protein